MHPVTAETFLKSRDEMSGPELALHTLIQELQKRTRTLENRMYKVERQPLGEQSNGTFAVPAMGTNGANGLPKSAPPTDAAATRAASLSGEDVPAKSLTHSGWALAVREQTNALIDVYADLCRYASERHGDVVSRDDVPGHSDEPVDQRRASVIKAYTIVPRPWKPSLAPVRDRKYLSWLRTQPCAICSSFRWIEAAHTGPRGLSQKADDRLAIPLCRFHHQHSISSWHNLGPVRFERLHKLDVKGLIQELHEMYLGASRASVAR